MSFAEAAAEMAAALSSEAAFGETLTVGGVEVLGTWSDVALEDLGSGFVADAVEVWIPRSAVASLTRGQQLVRGAGGAVALDLGDGVGLELGDGVVLGLEPSGEVWEIDAVQAGPVWWHCRCFRRIRPVPRGG